MAKETFSCLVTPPQVYISSDSENPNTVTLTASITNTSGSEVLMKALEVIVPLGSGGNVLAANQTAISTSATATSSGTWIMTPMGPGRYKAMPAGGMDALAHGDSVIISLYNVDVEATPGSVSIGFVLKTSEGTQEYSAIVNKVEGSLKIDSLSASTTTIIEGQTTELSWATTNASRVSLSPGDFGDIDTSGSVTVKPGKTTTYTLKAWGSGPVQSEQIEIQIARVGFRKFKADNVIPGEGQEVTLSWETELAKEVTLMPGNVPLALSGSCVVSSPEPALFQLIAMAEDGTQALRNWFVHVREPEILGFTAELFETDEDSETSCLLTFQTKHATKCSIQWIPAGGTKVEHLVPEFEPFSEKEIRIKHEPTVSGIYALVAEGYNGPAEATAEISIPIEISDFDGLVHTTPVKGENGLTNFVISGFEVSASAPGAIQATFYVEQDDDYRPLATVSVKDGDVSFKITYDESNPCPIDYTLRGWKCQLMVMGPGAGNEAVYDRSTFKSLTVDF